MLPLWISFSLYRFGSNVRSGTVPGIVAAGAIGMLLWGYTCGFYHAETSAVPIVVAGAVGLLGMASRGLCKMSI